MSCCPEGAPFNASSLSLSLSLKNVTLPYKNSVYLKKRSFIVSGNPSNIKILNISFSMKLK